VNLAPEGVKPKMVKMGIQLAPREIEEYKNLLLEFGDVFAWFHMDLKGILSEIAQHMIPLLPNTKPIRQKEMRMNPRMALIVKAKLERLLTSLVTYGIKFRKELHIQRMGLPN
jgi:hypothetical protein